MEQEVKDHWFSYPKVFLLLFAFSLIIFLFLLIRFFISKQLKLELASPKLTVKRKVIFFVITFFLMLKMLLAILELGGTKTGPKPTNFRRIRIVLFLLILSALIINFVFYLLSKFFLSAEQVLTMLQTKTYLFQGKPFQLIGRGKLFFSHWRVKGNLVFRDEKENILDINFVCLVSNSQLNHLRNLLKEVKFCPRQKLNWWDWLAVIAIIFAILFIFFCIIFLASF